MALVLRLDRTQLARIAGDPQAIKQFERLFSLVEGELNQGQLEAIALLAGIGANRAEEAIAAIPGPDFTPIVDLSAIEERLSALERLPLAVHIEQDDVSPPTTPHVVNHRYGVFYDVSDQVAALANTAYSVEFDTVAMSNGVTISGTQISVDRSEVFRLDFRAQLFNSGGSDHTVWVWLSKNGTDVADTAATTNVRGSNIPATISCSGLIELNAGDYVEVKWAVSNVGLTLNYTAASAPVPAIPSARLVVTDNVKGD